MEKGLKLENLAWRRSARAQASSGLRKSQIRIEVWSDYVCPFCYLEEPVLNRIAHEYRDDLILEWKAFELRPEPHPLLDPDGEYLHVIWNRAVYPMAHLRAMKLRLPPIQPRSRRAFETAEFAREHGRFAEMHDGLFRAFFQEGRDISSVGVLLQIGAAMGLDTGELGSALETGRYSSKVIAEEESAHELGISGVPSMVMSYADRPYEIESLLSGAQPYELVRATIERLRAKEE